VNGAGRDKVDPLTSFSFLYLVSRESTCVSLFGIKTMRVLVLEFIDN
jgi:hypothetical protein